MKAPPELSQDKAAPKWMAAVVDKSLLLSLIPFAFLAWFVAECGVNVPFLDQWGLPWVFEGVKHGDFSGILAFNNEHRIIVPRLIWTALAFLDSWNVKVEMFVSVIFTLAMFIGMTWRVREESDGASHVSPDLTLFVSSLVLCAFVQWDTYLWGFQFSFVLVNVCVVFGILILSSPRIEFRRKLIFAGLCCLIASFSSLQGLLSWFVMLPCLLLLFHKTKGRIVAGLIVAAIFGVVAVVYQIGYVRGTVLVPPLTLLPSKQFVLFFLSLAGGPLAQGLAVAPPNAAATIGGVLVGGFVILIALSIHARQYSRAAPWIAIGLLSLGFDTITSIGRASWGWQIAVTMSRYMSITVLLTVAVLQMLRQWGELRPAYKNWIAFFAGGIALLSITGSARGLSKGYELKQARSDAAGFMEVLPYIDPKTDAYPESCIFPLFDLAGYTKWVRQPAMILNNLGFRKIVSNAEFVEHPSTFFGSFDVPEETNGPAILGADSQVRASGWAVIPNRAELPKIVMISVGQQRLFITGAGVGTIDRPDIAKYYKNPKYLRCGWSVQIPAKFLPEGDSVLRAWVFDEQTKQFIELLDPHGVSKRIIKKSK